MKKKKACSRILICFFIALVAMVVGISFLVTQSRHKEALFNAIEREDVETVRSILRKSPNLVNAHRYSFVLSPSLVGRNDTPLTLACLIGNKQLISVLVEDGANVNQCEPLTGESPLLCTLMSHSLDRYEIALDLVLQGANISAHTSYENVFSLAIRVYSGEGVDGQRKSIEFISFLLKNGAEFKCPEWYEYHYGTLLAVAAGFNNQEALKFLIDQNLCTVNATSEENMTALMIAAQNNAIESVEILMLYGADKDITSCEGKTALDYAIQEQNAQIIELLSRNAP